jgi:5-hydroxyisourate hydrolase/2-oxo-4-hydroxy-4-carboxy-5-ureidoimidazoline decarboxylase
MAIAQLNALPLDALRVALLRACGSDAFATLLAAARPFASAEALHEAALRVWWRDTPVSGWLQALAAHPRLGDVSQLRAKFAATAEWCEGEQAAALGSATEEALRALLEGNAAFEARFGHTFVLCATGVPAPAVLAALQARLSLSPLDELKAAAGEQAKITALRLDKLLASLMAGAASSTSAERRVAALEAHVSSPPRRPPITTHVLDTARGLPAAGLQLRLETRPPGGGEGLWSVIGSGRTDSDGRCATLLPPGSATSEGEYRLSFETGPYLRACGVDAPFYPCVSVCFCISREQAAAGQHFHVPLLLAPFGFSTYRGS